MLTAATTEQTPAVSTLATPEGATGMEAADMAEATAAVGTAAAAVEVIESR